MQRQHKDRFASPAHGQVELPLSMRLTSAIDALADASPLPVSNGEIVIRTEVPRLEPAQAAHSPEAAAMDPQAPAPAADPGALDSLMPLFWLLGALGFIVALAVLTD